MKRSGFTLIQTLFGLAVLIGVVLFLFPLLARPRENVHRPTCQTNLKQIALGFKQYAQDYNEKYPPIRAESLALAKSGHAPYGWLDVVQPYLKSYAIFQCPQRTDSQPWPVDSWQRGITDYYMNQRIAGVEETKFENSFLTVMFGEGNDGRDMSDGRYAYARIPSEWRTNEKTPLYVHREGCNFSFLDGHVKWFQAENAPRTRPSGRGEFTFAP